MAHLGGHCEQHQDLSRRLRPAKHQIAEKSFVPQLVIERQLLLSAVCPHFLQDRRHIGMCQLTGIRVENRISRSGLMHSEGQRSPDYLIPEGQVQFVPVPQLMRASLYPVKNAVFGKNLFQQVLHLLRFHFQLCLIRKGLVQAASAFSKLLTERLPRLKRGFFKYFQTISENGLFVFFIDTERNFLAGDHIFHDTLFTGLRKTEPSLIRIIHTLDQRLSHFFSFHISSFSPWTRFA